MRRIVLVTTASVLALAACGTNSSGGSATTANPSSSATSAPASSAADATATTTPAASTTPTSSTVPVTTRPPQPKPSVQIPSTLPTELKITDLVVGTGDPAANGDQVVVNYVGVRSKDGVEFDNSYDRGQPFTVTLGAGSVIKGWDQGLVGAKAGGRRQLDVPSALAYGASSQGDKIGPNEDLTFVIDVLAVIKPVDATKEPSFIIQPSTAPVSEIQTTEMVVGTGPAVQLGWNAGIVYIIYRADTGEKLFSSWASGVQTQPLVPNGNIDGLINGIVGMKVGGRRKIVIPAAQILGGKGDTQSGLPANTDVIAVVDLLAAY